jgi:SAM-dependent methyltransferase
MTTTDERPAGPSGAFSCSAEDCRGCALASPDCHRAGDELTIALEYDRWLAGRGLRARHMRFLMSTVGALLVNTPALLLADVLNLQPHHRLLDLGCGRASVSRILAARVPLETPPLGLDVSRVMLGMARKDASPGAPNAPELARATVTALPLQDESVDAAVAAHVIKHLPDEAVHVLLCETARVLRPGGRLVLWEFARTGSRSADYVHRRLLGDRVRHMRLRSFGEIAALSIGTGFGKVSILKRQPFLYPPIPRVAVALEK